jgi:hypothetical protein
MAAGPFRRKPLGLDVPRTSAMESPPAIAALFVIRFDIKAGYVISWKRTVPGVEVEGVVEYKSLPSGLHNVSEDLVYFVHDQYAGISAFVNHPAEEAERNAKMFAIGVLVPLASGRLGKSWRHAPKLKELAQCVIRLDHLNHLSKQHLTYDFFLIDPMQRICPILKPCLNTGKLMRYATMMLQMYRRNRPSNHRSASACALMESDRRVCVVAVHSVMRSCWTRPGRP